MKEIPHLLGVLYGIVGTIFFNQKSDFFFVDPVSLPIYTYTVIYLAASLLYILKERQKKTIRFSLTLPAYVSITYLLMILTYVVLLLDRDLFLGSFFIFLKVGFLIEVMILVDGLIVMSIVHPSNFIKISEPVSKKGSIKKSDESLSDNYVTSILSELVRYVEFERNYRNPNLKLSQVASEIGYPPHDVSKVINSSLGKNFNEYINEHRIKSAEKLLVESSELRINEVMYVVGFNSKSIFHHLFKSHFGQTPGDYRRARQLSEMEKVEV